MVNCSWKNKIPKNIAVNGSNAPKIAGKLAIIASIAPLNASPNELIIDTKLSTICGANSAIIAIISGITVAIIADKFVIASIKSGAIL